MSEMVTTDAVPASDGLVRPVAVARMLDVGVRTLWRWASDGTFPPPDVRVGTRVVRWRRETVDRWIEENTETPSNRHKRA